MSNIYEISQELLAIFAEVEENEGELTPELEEKLNITQDNLKDKLKSYSDFVKSLQGDILLIKKEKDRLNALQKSKEATIQRLEKVMLEAVELFGAETKSGGKYIDFGTGKVSVRNSQVLEVDDEDIDHFVNRYISGLNWYEMQNQLDRGIIESDNLLRYANQFEEDDEMRDLNFSIDDVNKINAVIDLKVPIQTLMDSDRGFELAKALIRFGNFGIKASVNKTDIKSSIKETGAVPTFAKLVPNKTVQIK